MECTFRVSGGAIWGCVVVRYLFWGAYIEEWGADNNGIKAIFEVLICLTVTVDLKYVKCFKCNVIQIIRTDIYI